MGARRFAVIGMVSGVLGMTLLAGCGQPGDTRPAAQGGGEHTSPARSDEESNAKAASTWADRYCRAAAEVVHSASRMPEIDTSTPQRTTATSGEMLTVMIGGLDSALERLGKLGDLSGSGVEGTKRLRKSTIDTYTTVREHAVDARRALRQKGADAVGTVRETLDRIGRLDLVGGLDEMPELREASSDSDTCTQLTTAGRTSIAPHP